MKWWWWCGVLFWNGVLHYLLFWLIFLLPRVLIQTSLWLQQVIHGWDGTWQEMKMTCDEVCGAAFVLREFKHLSYIITFSSLKNRLHWFTSKMIKTVLLIFKLSWLMIINLIMYRNKKQWKWRHSCYRKGRMWGLTQRSAEERLDFVFILWFVTLNMKHFQGADLITTMENMKTGNEGGKRWQ